MSTHNTLRKSNLETFLAHILRSVGFLYTSERVVQIPHHSNIRNCNKMDEISWGIKRYQTAQRLSPALLTRQLATDNSSREVTQKLIKELALIIPTTNRCQVGCVFQEAYRLLLPFDSL